jgi:hypothetical protein
VAEADFGREIDQPAVNTHGVSVAAGGEGEMVEHALALRAYGALF